MKDEKINLEELQVESFITSLSPEEQAEQKGGTTWVCATVTAVATLATGISYDTGKEASWYFCDDDEEKKKDECACYE